jgi:hypothetical protein
MRFSIGDRVYWVGDMAQAYFVVSVKLADDRLPNYTLLQKEYMKWAEADENELMTLEEATAFKLRG